MDTLTLLRTHYLDQPNEVSIELWAMCNARCTFCPYPVLERKGAKLKDELLDSLIDQMATWQKPFTLAPFKLSEPFLDPRLIPFCQKVNEKIPHARLRLFSNGSPLTPEKIEAVSKLKNVHHLWVSLNETDPEKYEALMGLKFANTAKKLDYLHSIDFPHPVMLSTVGFPNEDFRRYCYDRWPKFDSMAIHRTSWLGYVTPQDRPVPDRACARWFELSIAADGDATLCCMSSGEDDEDFSLGNVYESSLLAIYNAPKNKARRTMMWSRKAIHPCKTCNYG